MKNLNNKPENLPLRYLCKGRIVFDLDDTIFKFRQIDKKIITAIFGTNKIIIIIDRFLWYLNSLDILPNGMNGLILRLWLYSIMAGIELNQVLIQYEESYKYELSNYDFSEFIELVAKIKEKGYLVEVRTNNKFAEEFKISESIIVRHYSNKKTTNQENNIKLMIGDKLSDLLAAKRCSAKFLYVKNSLIMKAITKFTSNLNIKGDFKNIIEYID